MAPYTRILPLLLLAAPAAGQVTVYHHSGFSSPLHFGHVDHADIGSGFLVAEAGTGNSDGRITFLADGSLSRQEAVIGLPSILAPEGFPSGVHDVILTDTAMFVAIGKTFDKDLHNVVVGFDLTSTPWVPGDSPLTVDDIAITSHVGEFVASIGYDDSNVYSLTEGHNGHLYIVDAGANSIIKYNQNTGSLHLHAELPGETDPGKGGTIQPVPTRIRYIDNAYFVSTLSGFPFLPGLSKIYRVNQNGNYTVRQDGLSLVTDFSYDPVDGNLVVSQFGEFGAKGFVPFSGSIVKFNDNGAQVPVSTGVHFPTSVEHTSDGTIYFGSIATGDMYRIDSGSMSYCAGAPNSVGDGGVLSNSGSESVGANDLAFTGVRMSADSFGVLLMGSKPVQIPLGDGFLCTNGPDLARLMIVQTDSRGHIFHAVDNTDLPAHAPQIAAGAICQFQFWYRDFGFGDAGFNLTNGVQILFNP